MSLSKNKVIAAAGVILCAAIYLHGASHPGSLSGSRSDSSDGTARADGALDRGSGVEAKGASNAAGVGPAAMSSGPAVSRRTASLTQPKPFVITSEQRQTLAAYAKISKKVFLSDADKKERARLLHDRSFIKSLAPIVTASTANDSQGGDAQNNALDLLYDALNADSKDAAVVVLGQVVQDNQVENKDLPIKDRENLAGVKGEALYEWTARDPAAAGKVSNLLPGKVSQQLWQNVQMRQQRNVASSAEENAKQK